MPVSPTESNEIHDFRNDRQAEHSKTRLQIKQVATKIGTVEDRIGAVEEHHRSVEEVVFN